MLPAPAVRFGVLAQQPNEHDQRLGAGGSAGKVEVGTAVRVCADALKQSQRLEPQSSFRLPD